MRPITRIKGPFILLVNNAPVQAPLQPELPGGAKPRYEPALAGPHLMGKFRKSVTF